MSDNPLTPDVEERLQRYLAGEMTDEQREAFEREALDSEALSAELYAEMNMTASMSEAAGELRRTRHAGDARPAWTRWLSRLAVPVVAAAALVIAAVTLFSPSDQSDPVFRGADAGISGIEPSGTLPVAPTTFRWTSEPSARRYRFEIFDDQSAQVLSLTTADTLVTLDEPAPPDGYWVVTPLDANGVPGTASALVFYRVTP